MADTYAAAGYEVVGTATSGQAARTLGREAGLAGSRTLASLLWRLDHGSVRLNHRHVVVLDEAGMTDDPAMLRLLTACELSGAKVVMVGDHRQLGPVGPGGALRALLNRHHGIVHVLDENVRQKDPEERRALARLRRGKVAEAVEWYAAHDRIRIAPDADEAQRAMVDAWYADTSAGKDAAMYAWRRTNVDELNRHARDRFAIDGRLSGPDLIAPGGRRYAVGDRIVTLAPTADGQVVTSQRGQVEAVDLRACSLTVRMDDSRLECLAGDELGADRLAHSYAITVHRSQASTVEVAHRLEDGGGRSLAYVSMSRARECSTVHVVADDLDQAVEDLTRDWSVDHRARWAIDSGTPATEPLAVEDHRGTDPALSMALRYARLDAERRPVAAAVPPDPTAELEAVNRRLAALHQDRRDVSTGHGRYAGTPQGDAARHLIEARGRHREAVRYSENAGGWRNRRSWHREAQVWSAREAEAQLAYDQAIGPETKRLDERIRDTEARRHELQVAGDARTSWLEQHPEAARRLGVLDRELHPPSLLPEIEAILSRGHPRALVRDLGAVRPEQSRGMEIDFGP